MHSISRLLDAVTNRCSEGLRVLEDIARFIFDDADVGSKLKEYRHLLRQKISSITGESSNLLNQRDIEEDAGTGWKTSGEYTRASLSDVISANSKRIQEGLRTLEELSKNVDSDQKIAQFIENLRYAAYSIEKILISMIPLNKLKKLKFMLIFDPGQCLSDPFKTLEIAIQNGVDSVQFRVKNYTDDENSAFLTAQKTQEICKKNNATFFINDRADWAILLGADGLHVGQTDLQVATARKILNPEQIIGFSISNEKELIQAQNIKADYLGAGAAFPTQTKPECELSGLNFYQKVLETAKIPVFSIGGINENNVSELAEIAAKAKRTLRVCVASAILKSEKPGKITAKINEFLYPK